MGEIKFYSIQEISRIMKFSRRNIYRWVKSGYLPAIKIGREYRIAESDLNLFIEKCKKSC